MRFQARDGEILWTLHDFDGVLALRQIKSLFWPGATLRAVQKRLSKLYEGGYLARPTRQDWKMQPISEPVYWLGWKGALYLAQRMGVAVEKPSSTGENQLRRLATSLREQGIRWLREPRWFQLRHDLAVADCRLSVVESLKEVPFFSLEEWIHEGIFRCDIDVVEYAIEADNGIVYKGKRGVCPDSYFVILDKRPTERGVAARARLLLELDNSSHPNKRFGEEKVVPGIAYLQSTQYKERFGDNSGRWLVVTTGAVRMQHLIRETARVAGAAANGFLFTTFDQFKSANVFTKTIWWQAGQEQPLSLLTLLEMG